MRTKAFKQWYCTDLGHWKHTISSHNWGGHPNHMLPLVPRFRRWNYMYRTGQKVNDVHLNLLQKELSAISML
jgi:hypothetical protein